MNENHRTGTSLSPVQVLLVLAAALMAAMLAVGGYIEIEHGAAGAGDPATDVCSQTATTPPRWELLARVRCTDANGQR